MTSKSKKDKIKQGNQKDFDLLYDVLVSGGTYSDYKSELLDRSMPQEQLNFDISEDDVLAAWILGKDEESELYARGGHLHQGDASLINTKNLGKTGEGLDLPESDKSGYQDSDSGSNFNGFMIANWADNLAGLGTNAIANQYGASNDPYARFIMGDSSKGFLGQMMSQDASVREGANYIKGFELNFGYGDTDYLRALYDLMQPIARSTMNTKAVDTAKWFFDPTGLLHNWGFANFSASEALDYLNSIAEQVENRNKQNFNTAVTNSNKLNLWNKLSQPYMAVCGGKMKNKLASGGYINSHYDYITDPLVKVDAGGTHQENPNEGVLTSIAPDGKPNLVEQGETIIDNGQEDAYVFSDRIVADDEILKSHLLPNKFAGKTYADISKELDKIIEEHKNDEISKRTFDEMISRLQQAQEDQKFQEKQEEVEKFLDGLTDEQKEQLEQTMVEEAEAEQQAAEEQAVAEQQAQELAALEQQIQPEQAPEQVVMEQPEEQIVPSRYDQMMSRTLFADAANQGMFGLGGTLQEGGFIDRLKKTMTTSSHPQVVYWDNARIPKQSYGTFGGGKSGGASYSGRWGDVDYIENTPIPATYRTFDEAFADAVRNNINPFYYNGKPYSNEIDPNYSGPGKKELELVTPALNEREVYTKTGEKLNDSTRIEPYVGQPIGWTERETIDDKTKLKYIGSEPDWDNKKSKGGHLHQYDPWIYSQIDEDYPSLKKTGLKSNYVTFVPEETNYGYTGEKRVAGVNLPDEEMLDYNLVKTTSPDTAIIVEEDISTKPKDKPITEKQNPDYSTYLRYAPAVGSGIQYLSDLFGVTNRNDYTNPNLFQRSINLIPNVGFTPLGGYRTFNPFDETYQQNALRSMNLAARRAVINNANGNYGAALAALDALNYNTSGQFGDLALKAREYNEKERQAIDEYNLKINQINASLSMNAQEKNQAIAAQKARLTAALAEMRQQIEDTNDTARSANMTNFYQNLGNVGKENFNMTMVRSNPAFYYTITDDGHILYKNGFDGLNERDQAFVRSVAEPQAEELRKKHLEEANKKADETMNPDRTNWSPMMYSYSGRPSLFGYRSLTNNWRN